MLWRYRHEPFAYLTRQRAWRDLELEVNRSVLIPRQETEEMATLAVSQLLLARQSAGQRVVDVGTGTGALAIALALAFPKAEVVGVDISLAALRVARRNCQRSGVHHVHLRHTHLLTGIEGEFALIMANLPYIPSAALGGLQAELAFEPRVALDGGADGLALIADLLPQARTRLAPGGSVVLECGHDQAEAVALAMQEGWPAGECRVVRDGAGIERFVVLCASEAAETPR